MKRPASFHPKRVSSIRRGMPANRTESAIEMVRIEFERQRLERELDQCRRRAMIATEALEQYDKRGRQLHAALAIRDEPT